MHQTTTFILSYHFIMSTIGLILISFSEGMSCFNDNLTHIVNSLR